MLINKMFSCLSIIAAIVIFCSPVPSLAKESLPHLNNGQKWRIAYYQGGPIPFYRYIYKEILNDLMQRGWIDAAELPEQGLGAEPPFWDWLCNTATSKYLEFLPINGYSASWDEAKRGNLPFSLSFNDTTAKAVNFKVPESICRIAHGIYEK